MRVELFGLPCGSAKQELTAFVNKLVAEIVDLIQKILLNELEQHILGGPRSSTKWWEFCPNRLTPARSVHLRYPH